MSTESPVSPVLPRFDVKPYRPDGGFSPSGIILLASALMLAGAGLGFAAHFVAKLFYLIVLFPFLIALGVGAVGMRMTRMGRIRNPLIGGLAGFLGGCLAMFMMHYFDFRDFRAKIDAVPEARAIASIPREQRERVAGRPLSPKDHRQLDALVKAVNVTNVFAFLDMSAEEGVRLKGRGSGDGINLGYYGSYIYWIIEILIVAGVTYVMVRESTTRPFCVRCDQWKTAKTLGSLGADPSAAAAAVRSGDLNLIYAAGPNPADGAQRVTIAACDDCVGQGDVDLKLECITKDGEGKTQTSELAHVSYPAQSLPHLVQLFAAKPAPAAAPEAPPSPSSPR